MNWAHLKAMLWMRWRILVNRVRRGGKVGNVLLAILFAFGALLSMGLFVLALVVGVEVLPDVKPVYLSGLWVGFAVLFFMMWLVGLVMDLQRSDAMSFKNLLHLPVSLSWVFLYNYLGSFVSLSIAVFLPAMLGFCVAMVITHGPIMLLSIPLVFAYFGMVTATTYQLRGWLSRLMEDKRRGRNIVALITFGLVVVMNVPNLTNMYFANKRAESVVEEVGERKSPERRKAEDERELADFDRVLSLGTAIVPLGWLPYGVRSTFDGRWWFGLSSLLGMFGITAWSLRRSFRSTLASFLGEERSQAPAAAVELPAFEPRSDKLLMVQRTVPFTDEQTSGIAMASLRSLLRSPEGKLMLLGPVILLLLFGTMLFSNEVTPLMRTFAPMMSLGATMMGLLSISQLTQNQFGLDRDGFRAFVLSPVPRHMILRGKNYGAAPMALAFGLLALTALTAFIGLSPLHFLGACFQVVSAFLILCMIGNLTSILLPMRLKPQGMKAAKPKFSTILWHLLSVILIPVALSPLLIPFGIETVWGWQHLPGGEVVYLVLHAVMMLATYLVYCWVLKRQGGMFQDREQHILDLLTRE